MKVPKQHGRPGPYTREQHQGISSLNQAIDLREELSINIDAMIEAKQRLSIVKCHCSQRQQICGALSGTTHFSTTTLNELQQATADMQVKIPELLALVIPRNFTAVTLLQEVRDKTTVECPWDGQLMARWWTIADEIQSQLEAQIDSTVAALNSERQRIMQFKYNLSRVLEDDILQWSL